MVEIFSHGGLGVIKGIVGFLEQLGMREAEPGEFTRLSVANNKMSLNEAEMVSTLIDSIDEHEVMLSVAAISGALSERVVRIGDSIDLLRVELESQIDFSDEDGVNEENVDRLGVCVMTQSNSWATSEIIQGWWMMSGRKKVFCWWVHPTQENPHCLIVCWEGQGLSRLMLQEQLEI